MYSLDILIYIQGKLRSYEQFHIYYSNYMNDESNEESINLLQSNVDTNIFSKFLMLQYGCEIKEDLDLNIKDYELYKNSLKTEESDNISEISSGFDDLSLSQSKKIVASKKKMKTKVIVRGNWYKKKEIDDRVKEITITINKGFSVTPFGKKFGYGHGPSGSIFNVSLPCPVPSCRFGGFSKIYDSYVPELKQCLLTNNNKHDAVNMMNFSWIDWSYNVNRNDCWRASKRVMKKCMATHFARMQQLDEFPNLQRNSPFKRHHEQNLHNVDLLPLSWQKFIKNEVVTLKKNMPTCIEE